jgi:hypothetical protein
MVTIVYRDDRKEGTRINERLAPMPDNGATPCCQVVTQPTRCITRVYPGGLQARQPMIDDQPQDPFAQRATGGYGSGNASGNPGDDIY